MFSIVLYRNCITNEIREVKNIDNVPDDVCGRHFHINLTTNYNERQYENVPDKGQKIINNLFVKNMWISTGLYFITVFSAIHDDSDDSDAHNSVEDRRRKRRKINANSNRMDIPEIFPRNMQMKNVDEDSGTDLKMEVDDVQDMSVSYSDDEGFIQ